MKIGDRVFVSGYIDEIRKDTVIVRNDGGYFGTTPSEVITGELPSAQPEIIRCKDCKHFHYDMPYVIQGIPVLGHEVCDFWGDGCKTSENGFCSFAEE